LRFFNSININNLRCIEAIVGEIHLKHGDINDIAKKLKTAGFKVYCYHPPLITKHTKPRVRVEGLTRLKFLRTIIYACASIGKLKDKDLKILFAKNDKNNSHGTKAQRNSRKYYLELS